MGACLERCTVDCYSSKYPPTSVSEDLYRILAEKATRMHDSYKNNSYIEVSGFTVNVGISPSVSVNFEFKNSSGRSSGAARARLPRSRRFHSPVLVDPPRARDLLGSIEAVFFLAHSAASASLISLRVYLTRMSGRKLRPFVSIGGLP